MELESITESALYHGKLHQILWEAAQAGKSTTVLPGPESLERARKLLPTQLDDNGRGFENTREHILNDLVPAFNHSSINPNYYGFVTGGVTPAALLADNIVSAYDQNVQVHLSEHSIATDVEYTALCLLAQLLKLDDRWYNGTFTTGATASNILGLACGREYVLKHALQKRGASVTSVGESGLFETMQAAGLSGIQVLSAMPHSSLVKAAGVLGIGRANVKNVGLLNDPVRFDLGRLATELQRPGMVSIVAVSCGEVNTGYFATDGYEEMQVLRHMCDTYGAWLHVDGAFGIFARILEPSPEFTTVQRGCEGIELADSITGDAHKFLNVPYDCGFFFCSHAGVANNVFCNANAAYLVKDEAAQQTIPSPLNIGIENSRRFRALPVYSSLVAYGRKGYQTVLQRQIRLARKISDWLYDHPKYDILPYMKDKQKLLDRTFLVVLFKAKDEFLNDDSLTKTDLAARINRSSKMFVSGTTWEGENACRIAISNWRVDEDREFALIRGVLDNIVG